MRSDCSSGKKCLLCLLFFPDMRLRAAGNECDGGTRRIEKGRGGDIRDEGGEGRESRDEGEGEDIRDEGGGGGEEIVEIRKEEEEIVQMMEEEEEIVEIIKEEE